jgi:hypothetical protein
MMSNKLIPKTQMLLVLSVNMTALGTLEEVSKVQASTTALILKNKSKLNSLRKKKLKKRDLLIYPKMKIIVKSTKTITFDDELEDSSASDAEADTDKKNEKQVPQVAKAY